MTGSTATANAAFLGPIARAFVSAGARPDSILARIAHATENSKELFLPLPLIYTAIQLEADELGDPTLGFRAGNLFAKTAFSELLPYQRRIGSLPGAILDFSIWLSKNTSGTPINLYVGSESASLSQHRAHLNSAKTAQSDAFTVALLIETIRQHVLSQYEPEKVTIAISEPGLVAANLQDLGAVKVLAHSGFAIEFPVVWLLSEQVAGGDGLPKSLLGTDNFISAFDHALRNVIGLPLPKLARTAELLNFTPRELQLELEQRGTTYTKLATRINSDFAKDQLTLGEVTATRIGELLGYSDHSSFSRAFKSWTNMSPEQYRTAQAQPDNPGGSTPAA